MKVARRAKVTLCGRDEIILNTPARTLIYLVNLERPLLWLQKWLRQFGPSPGGQIHVDNI